MPDNFPYFREALHVCPVESDGACFALPERDVIAVLPLDDDTLERVCGLLAMGMDERYRPLISLRTALCQPAGPAGTVVVLRIGDRLFGLLVDRAFAPVHAGVLPTLCAAPARATFSRIVRLDDGSDLAVLNPASLLAVAQPPDSARLAA
jgi:hypothetical protein